MLFIVLFINTIIIIFIMLISVINIINKNKKQKIRGNNILKAINKSKNQKPKNSKGKNKLLETCFNSQKSIGNKKWKHKLDTRLEIKNLKQVFSNNY